MPETTTPESHLRREKPPVKLSPSRAAAWRHLRAAGVATSAMATAHNSRVVNRKVFDALENLGLARVTRFGAHEWVAEPGDAFRPSASVAVPPLPSADDSSLDNASVLRSMHSAASFAVSRARPGHPFGYSPVSSTAGELAGWVVNSNPSPWGTPDNTDRYGWVTADAQLGPFRYASEQEAADALLPARRSELDVLGQARRTALAFHPDAHTFTAVTGDEDQVVGWTYRCATDGSGRYQFGWVNADAVTVAQVFPDEGLACRDLRRYLRGDVVSDDEDARTRIRATYRRAFNLIRVYGEGGDQPLLGWMFSVSPGRSAQAYGERRPLGWMTTSGQVSGDLVAGEAAALRGLAGAYRLALPATA
ncbi:hypothetical protein ACFV4X_12345 [Streptomyces ardesiacus]|uniref:hypothetical protein n=1 Tax=Streptomyces ardesiacus TaxID=285564 RepID=UPI0036496A09